MVPFKISMITFLFPWTCFIKTWTERWMGDKWSLVPPPGVSPGVPLTSRSAPLELDPMASLPPPCCCFLTLLGRSKWNCACSLSLRCASGFQYATSLLTRCPTAASSPLHFSIVELKKARYGKWNKAPFKPVCVIIFCEYLLPSCLGNQQVLGSCRGKVHCLMAASGHTTLWLLCNTFCSALWHFVHVIQCYHRRRMASFTWGRDFVPRRP